MRILMWIGLVSVLSVAPAAASTITFEDRTGPSFFDFTNGPETVTYTLGTLQVTFNGGVILTTESNQSSDFTSVYATGSWQVPALSDISHDFQNPLTVAFTAPIQNFQFDILNALAGDYELYDNAGNSTVFTLTTTGDTEITEGFAATGSLVSLRYLSAPYAWDFAIDNVTFNQPLTIVPEPATLALVGLPIFTAVRRRLISGRRATLPRRR